jgi:hypothetical protein
LEIIMRRRQFMTLLGGTAALSVARPEAIE